MSLTIWESKIVIKLRVQLPAVTDQILMPSPLDHNLDQRTRDHSLSTEGRSGTVEGGRGLRGGPTQVPAGWVKQGAPPSKKLRSWLGKIFWSSCVVPRCRVSGFQRRTLTDFFSMMLGLPSDTLILTLYSYLFAVHAEGVGHQRHETPQSA